MLSKPCNNIGILLLNLGGPDSLQAVRPFLYNLFSDRKIIKLGPAFLQQPIAWLISTLRSKKTEGMYRLIGNKSPILDITRAQAQALEEELNSSALSIQGPAEFKVYVGMRYWHPLIEDTVSLMYNDGIRNALAVSLYPHYSLATSGSAISRLNDIAKEYEIKFSFVSSWFDHPGYIDALAAAINKGLESFSSELLRKPLQLATPDSQPEVLFSAHSLPMSIVETGDPYVEHITGTINAVMKKINLKWHLAYQSRSGPVKWLSPSIDEKIRELAGKGIRNLLVVPVSFVSDHIETLYEIDILYKGLAEGLGMRLERTESLNTNPLFIKALKDIVIENVKELACQG